MYNKPTSGQQSVAKFKILILMNTVKVVAELELLLDRLYLPALNLLRRRIRMEWLTRAWNWSVLNPPLPSFMSTQEVSIKATKLKNSQPGWSYKMMQWYSTLLTFSFIKEGTSKKVLQFLMPLEPIYNKSLFEWAKILLLTLPCGLINEIILSTTLFWF